MSGLIFPALLGFVFGVAVQLQQVELNSWQIYTCFVLLALVLSAWAATKNRAISYRVVLAFLAMGVLAFGVTGLRAVVFSNQALDSALEGRDVTVVGVIAAMPQRNESGLRFRFDVDSAHAQGVPVVLPPRIYLGWYAGVFGGGDNGVAVELQRQPAALEAGERWQMTVRLKAPHGASNPDGFDYELWLWEQGLQATGYVRAGPKDPVPQRLAQTHAHPVERLRQQVRDDIFERVPERQSAGLIAALVVGDQNAIDRWTPTLKSLNGFPSETMKNLI